MESIEVTASELAEIGKETLRLISNRGTMEILTNFCCSRKVVRFTELSNLFNHISTKTLASRLKELEKEGILKRTAYNEIPPRVEYSMTAKGQSLAEAISPIVGWIFKWAKPMKSAVQKAKDPGSASTASKCEGTCATPTEQTAGRGRKASTEERSSSVRL